MQPEEERSVLIRKLHLDTFSFSNIHEYNNSGASHEYSTHAHVLGRSTSQNRSLAPRIRYRSTGMSSYGEERSEENSSTPNYVTTLESVIQTAHPKSDIAITRIQKVDSGRKNVFKISYIIDNETLKTVWAFKSEDPALTTRELQIYQILNDVGVKSAKPLFAPPQPGEKYQFDIAFLGGVLEHAGGSYDEMLHEIAPNYKTAFGTAIVIAKQIADYQSRLQTAFEKGIFADAQIDIRKVTAEYELRTRLLKKLNPNTDSRSAKAQALIDAATQLERYLDSTQIVSHGDLHTKQIVTLNSATNAGLDLRNFGIIDFDLVLDRPLGDLTDFWVHHARKIDEITQDPLSTDFAIQKITTPYQDQYTLATLAEEYQNQMHTLQTSSLYTSSLQTTLLLQQALWHSYEMQDPARSEVFDIVKKQKYHWEEFSRVIDSIEREISNADIKQAAHNYRTALKSYLTSHKVKLPK
jgi:hypothetical protein